MTTYLGKYIIIRNAARCRKCGDVIESRSRHDWVPCSCGAIFVDGGHNYCRHGGNPEDIESLCEVETLGCAKPVESLQVEREDA